MVAQSGPAVLRPEQLSAVRGEAPAGVAAAADGDQAIPEGFLGCIAGTIGRGNGYGCVTFHSLTVAPSLDTFKEGKMG